MAQEIYGDRVSVGCSENWATKNICAGLLDITPLDFFLWGYVKDIVYRTKVQNITDLKQRISNAIATIDEDMLQRTWQEIKYRLDVLHLTNGAHIEMN